MPEWYSYHFKQQKPDLEIFLKIRFLPPCRPYRKFQKSARFGQNIFQPIKLSPWLIYNAWVIFLWFQATKARFGNISENWIFAPMPALSKIPKISQIWSKIFSTYKVISLTDLQCLSDILIISSNKSQIWKYFWKLDFCPHAGPIENSKNQPDLVKIFFKL